MFWVTDHTQSGWLGFCRHRRENIKCLELEIEPMNRILFLDNSLDDDPYQPLSYWDPLLLFPYDLFRVTVGEWPHELDSYSHILITGSAAGVLEPRFQHTGDNLRGNWGTCRGDYSSSQSNRPSADILPQLPTTRMDICSARQVSRGICGAPISSNF